MNIYIENEINAKFDFELESAIENAIQAVAQDKNLPDNLDVNVLITDEAGIQEINRENRGIDSPTDVLSFPYFEYETPGAFDFFYDAEADEYWEDTNEETDETEDECEADAKIGDAEEATLDESEELPDDESDAEAGDDFCEMPVFEDCENILGDMILCEGRIKSQAKEYGHSQLRELSFLVVHSMLHLLGYDHMEECDGEIMRAEEKRLMEILGISR